MFVVGELPADKQQQQQDSAEELFLLHALNCEAEKQVELSTSQHLVTDTLLSLLALLRFLKHRALRGQARGKKRNSIKFVH